MNTTKKPKCLIRIQGITLKSIDYGEYDKILHVFTREEGILHLIAKGANRPTSANKTGSQSLIDAEFLTEKKGEGHSLHVCREITPSDYRLYLRDDIDKLRTGCGLAHAVLRSQIPEHPAPPLFSLFHIYLDRIKVSANMPALSASFALKLLRYEGLFALPAGCSECGHFFPDGFFSEKLFYCADHRPEKSLFFSEEEFQILFLLAYSREISLIESLPISPELIKKIEIALY